MKYSNKSFTEFYGSKLYQKNWERMFGSKQDDVQTEISGSLPPPPKLKDEDLQGLAEESRKYRKAFSEVISSTEDVGCNCGECCCGKRVK